MTRFPWTIETMQIVNKLTPNIKGKAFDPDWFLLRQRFEEIERTRDNAMTKWHELCGIENAITIVRSARLQVIDVPSRQQEWEPIFHQLERVENYLSSMRAEVTQ